MSSLRCWGPTERARRPRSRSSPVFGKIVGESSVSSLTQGAGILAFGLLVGVSFTAQQVLALLPVALIVCLFGGAFGVLVLANLGSQRAANQVFPFILLPQFFLAGVFNPIQVLPWYLEMLSKISPMRYAVDLARGAFYRGMPEYASVVLMSPWANLAVIGIMFAIFLLIGTVLLVRGEQNR